MMPLYLFFILVLLLATPLRCQTDVQYRNHVTDICISIRVWGIPWRIRRRLPQQQHKAKQVSLRQGKTLLRVFLRGQHVRKMLLKAVQQADIHLLLSMEDAAATAMASGMLRTLVSCLPRGRLRLHVYPGFPAQPMAVQGRCMIFLHLGTILLSAVLALVAYALEAQQKSRKSQPEEG